MKTYKYDFYNIDYKKIKDWNDYNREWNKHFEEATAKSNALPNGLHVGKIFSIGVADGSAYYEVVKIFKTKVHLKWRKDLCPDEYMDHHFCDGGSFDRQDVEKYINYEDALSDIFSKNKKKKKAKSL